MRNQQLKNITNYMENKFEMFDINGVIFHSMGINDWFDFTANWTSIPFFQSLTHTDVDIINYRENSTSTKISIYNE